VPPSTPEVAEGYTPFALAGFELFFRPWLFSRVRIAPFALPDLPSGIPAVLVANHTSWWDPFVLREMHRQMRRGPLYTVMLESELGQRPFFRRIGVVGIEPSSVASVRSTVRTLRHRLRSHPEACLTYFPQGRIWPATRRPLGFLRGIELFVSHLAPVAVVPIGIRLEALNSTRPTIFTLPGAPSVYEDGKGLAAHLEAATEGLLDTIADHLERHGEAALENWPPSADRAP
jgi:1-acyl-sn-glycerol-3-phosphate acyltransferase